MSTRKKKTRDIHSISRRKFIRHAGAAVAAFSILPRFVLGGKGFIAPSDTLYIAGIGVGGKGESDLTGFAANPKAKIAFLCDVDDRMAAKSKANFPQAGQAFGLDRHGFILRGGGKCQAGDG